MNAIHRHWERITSTPVNLYEHAASEEDSVEQKMADLSGLADSADADQHGQERLETRREIIDLLIEETGGIANLGQLDLSESASPTNDIVCGVLYSIVRQACIDFIDNPDNDDVVREIESDSDFTDNRESFDGEFFPYLSQRVAEKMGVLLQ